MFSGLSAGNYYKHRCYRVGVILLSGWHLASSALAELQQLLHWARKMRLLGEGGCCNSKWESQGDEGIHWPAIESGVVPLGLWNSWGFIVIQTEQSAKPSEFSSTENKNSGRPTCYGIQFCLGTAEPEDDPKFFTSPLHYGQSATHCFSLKSCSFIFLLICSTFE